MYCWIFLACLCSSKFKIRLKNPKFKYPAVLDILTSQATTCVITYIYSIYIYLYTLYIYIYIYPELESERFCRKRIFIQEGFFSGTRLDFYHRVSRCAGLGAGLENRVGSPDGFATKTPETIKVLPENPPLPSQDFLLPVGPDSEKIYNRDDP